MTDQQVQEEKLSTNYSFEYRNIMHVGAKLDFDSEDKFKESIIAKFIKIDSGEHQRHVRPDSKLDLRHDYAKMQDDMKVIRENLASPQERTIDALQAEIDVLKAQAEEKEEVVIISNDDKETPKVEVETPQAVEPVKEPVASPIQAETKATIGKGDCPTCGKSFKRLDMHVCAAIPPMKPIMKE